MPEPNPQPWDSRRQVSSPWTLINLLTPPQTLRFPTFPYQGRVLPGLPGSVWTIKDLQWIGKLFLNMKLQTMWNLKVCETALVNCSFRQLCSNMFKDAIVEQHNIYARGFPSTFRTQRRALAVPIGPGVHRDAALLRLPQCATVCEAQSCTWSCHG